ncbi:hypothetical protein EJ04DRAFT_567476 [Polyplosphaeria fusca]|uniref:DUF6594 domain-containing protein n=1 Tax=Polyplosphaeria fusca TaxID=682080 RepID=A0A9P4QS81_9PLEO|nr:hypothetical protein EJ04DRAFT_567476 [Polyplosphaeria fusca]
MHLVHISFARKKFAGISEALEVFAPWASSRRCETLVKHAGDLNRPDKKRLEKLDELQGLLREYYETLLLQSQIAQYKGPSSRVLAAFRDYLEGKAFKSATTDAMPLISGRAKDFLSDKADLIALRRAAEEDMLSKLLQDHWPFPKRATDDPLDRTTIYKNTHVVRTVAGISMIPAAIVLIGAIVSLHAVTSDQAKLGLVATYTLLFAASITLLTNARRAEVFAATAAYAAVLVMFVSGDLGASSSEQWLVQMENDVFKTVRCPI